MHYSVEDLEYPKNYFGMPIRNLLFGGISIYEIENPSLKFLHKIYSVILIGMCGYGYMLTEVIHVFKHLNEMEELTLTLCYLFAHTIGKFMNDTNRIGKVIVLTVKRQSIGKFLKSLEKSVFLPNVARGGIEEVNIIKTAVAQTNTQARIFGLAVVSMLSTRIIPCLMHTTAERVKKDNSNETELIPIFPYPSTLPFPIDDSRSPYYEFEFFYQTFSIALFGWYLGNSDTIITGLMIHVGAQFKIVINAILTVTERAEKMTMIEGNKRVTEPTKYITCQYKNKPVEIESIEKYGPKFMENLRFSVNSCVRHHHEIIQLLDNMENTFSLLLLIQFLGSLMSLCVGLYQTSVLPITNPSFISMSSFTIAMLFQLLIYCWNGNEISQISAEVSSAAYNCEWLQSDKDIKTSLMLMMMRSQRASFLTAGKFTKISLETFTTIVRGSVSYFMVLRKMNEEQLLADENQAQK